MLQHHLKQMNDKTTVCNFFLLGRGGIGGFIGEGIFVYKRRLIREGGYQRKGPIRRRSSLEGEAFGKWEFTREGDLTKRGLIKGGIGKGAN